MHAWSLARYLPHRCGGLGVLTHTEMTSRAAYLSAAALTEKSVQKGDPAFLPFSGPSGHLMQDTYAVLQSVDGELPALSPETVAEAIPGLHTQVRRAHDDGAMLQSLKAVFQEHSNSESTVERIRGERNLARLHSVIDSGASKFMDAMPFCIFLQMNDQQYESGVWNYLSLIVSQ